MPDGWFGWNKQYAFLGHQLIQNYQVKEELEDAGTNGTSNASSSRVTVTEPPAESTLPGSKWTVGDLGG